MASPEGPAQSKTLRREEMKEAAEGRGLSPRAEGISAPATSHLGSRTG